MNDEQGDGGEGDWREDESKGVGAYECERDCRVEDTVSISLSLCVCVCVCVSEVALRECGWTSLLK